MTQSKDEYVKRMLRGDTMYFSDVEWFMRGDTGAALAAEIFMAIKDRCVYNKLSGTRTDPFADGREIQQAMDPSWKSFAFYWLQCDHIRAALKRLNDCGLIIKRMRHSAPYGYGDDEQYWLTDIAALLIQEAKTNEKIHEAAKAIIKDANAPRSKFHTGRKVVDA